VADDDSLIPAGGGSDPADDLEAASASVLEATNGAVLAVSAPPEPFGRTPKFDFEKGRMVMQGSDPVFVTGHDALIQWLEMAARTARYAHPVVSGRFGTETPDSVLGEAVNVVEAASDYGARLRDAFMQHDRITAVGELEVTYDPRTGVVDLGTFEIITDEGTRIPVDSMSIHSEGDTSGDA
jgi:hypothetical protein